MSGSAAAKASWAVAASMAAVEALKDQVGLCRWNYALRSLHHRYHAKAGLRPSSTHVQRLLESRGLKERRAAEKADNVMHLVCWGPK